MAAVTVSPKFQVVIPKEIREALGIVAGQKVQVLARWNRIELLPLKPMREMEGFLKDINTNVERDEESALAVIAHMQQEQVIPLDSELTIDAGNVGVVHKLPLADSIVFATAQKYAATVWTQDADFKGMAIVYNIVTAHLQGAIAIESEFGQGTTMTLSVPRVVP